MSSGPPLDEEKNELRREVIDFLKLVAWFLVIFLVLRSWVIEGYAVQGPSMEPNLATNERILVFKLPHVLAQWGVLGSYQPIGSGDIVVFDSPDSPGKKYVKRVIAVGPSGDAGTVGAASADEVSLPNGVRVRFEHGEVFVNDQKLEEAYLDEESLTSPDTHDITLGPNQYYVLGDHRKVSKDSRTFDAVKGDAVVGEAVLRFWPLSKISLF